MARQPRLNHSPAVQINRLTSGGRPSTVPATDQPLLAIYRIAFTTSRMSVLRERPPDLVGGISGAKVAYSRSIKSAG